MNKRYLTPAQIYYSLANLRQITFEVTDACNLKCKYCGYGEFYDDYDRRSNKMMPFTMAKQTDGLFARIIGKISALTVAQYVNYQNNLPIGRVKYALA